MLPSLPARTAFATRQPPGKSLFVFACAGLCLIAPLSAQTTLTWTGATANWNTTDANWHNGSSLQAWPAPNGDGTSDALANFFSVSAPIVITESVTANTLIFNNALSYSFSSTGPGALTLAASSASEAPQINVVYGSDVTLAVPLAGTSGFNKVGDGLLVLSGNNTFTGTLALQSGAIRATTSASALGAGALTLSEGTHLELANDTGLNFGRAVTPVGPNAFLVSDRLTPGAGVTHTLGALTIDSTYLNITAGSNVTSGTAGFAFGATTVGNYASFDVGAGAKLTLASLDTGGHATYFEGDGDTTISGNLLSTSGDSLFNKSGTGTLTLLGATNTMATLNLTGGAFVASGGSITGTRAAIRGAGSSATLTGSGTSWTMGEDLSIGGSGSTAATMTVSAGATLTANYLEAGDYAGNKGSLIVTGTGTHLSDTATGNSWGLIVGNYGSGNLTISNGATVNSSTVAVGYAAPGSVLLTGAGSSWTVSGNLRLGYTDGGVGSLTVADGATGRSQGVFTLQYAGGSGSLLVQDAGSKWTAEQGLTLSTGDVTVTNGGTLQFGTNADAGAYFASGTTLHIGTGATAGIIAAGSVDLDGDLTFNHTDNTTFSPNLYGAGNITKVGNGTLTLSGDNQYFTGNVTVSQGNLRATADEALTRGTLHLLTGSLEVAGDSGLSSQPAVPLSIDTTFTSNRLTSGSGRTHTVGDVSLGALTVNVARGDLVTSGTAGIAFISTTLTADGAVFNTPTGTSLTLGTLSGDFAFTKQGAGVLTLDTSSTRTGAVTTINAGTLRLAIGDALGTAPATLLLNSGTLEFTYGNDTTFHGTNIVLGGNATISSTVSGGSPYLGTLSLGNQTLSTSTVNGTITFGPTTLTANSAVIDVAADSYVTLGALAGSFSFTKQGSGQLTLGTASTRSGVSTTLSGGVLRLEDPAALGTAPATLTLNSGTLQLANDAPSTFSATNLALGGNATVTIDAFFGAIDLTHTIGTLALGANTLTVNRTSQIFSIGTLVAGNTTLSADAAVFNITNNAQLNLGALTGDYTFTKRGSGTLVLTAPSTRSGATTTVTSGTLILADPHALGTTQTTLNLNGGTLHLSSDVSSTFQGTNIVLGGNATIVADRLTPGGTVTHTLGTISLGNHTLTTTLGWNETDGLSNLVFGVATLAGNATLVPTINTNMTFGGTAGTGNLLIASDSTADVTFTGGLVNHTGTIDNSASGYGTLTLSGGVGSNVTAITQNSGDSSVMVSGSLAVNSGGTTLTNNNNTGGFSFLTLAGGVTGTGNLILNNQTPLFEGVTTSDLPVNPSGIIINSGTGTGEVRIKGGVGSNVTALYQDSATSPLTITIGALVVNSAGTTLSNRSASGTAPLTVSGNITGTGNLILNNNSSLSGGVSVLNAFVNPVGTITNSGTGTGDTSFTAAIGSNVTAITQASATSALEITGALKVNAAGTTLTNTGGQPFDLGGISGTGNLILNNNSSLSNGISINVDPVSNFIGTSGTITNSGTGTGSVSVGLVVNSAVTAITQASATSPLNLSGGLVPASAGTTLTNTTGQVFTLSGGVLGNGKLILNNNSSTAGGIALTGSSSVNPSGTITNSGTGSGSVTISSPVGKSVTGLTQGSATSALAVSSALAPSSNTTFTNSGGALLTLSGGVAGTTAGNVTLKNNTSVAGGITFSSASLNPTGNVTNSGTGTGSVSITGGTGNKVTGIIQASSTSPLTITTGSVSTGSSGLTLTNSGGAAFTITGGVSGTGNLTLKNNSTLASGFTFSTTSINPTGTITNSGTGTGSTSLGVALGSNVTTVTQNSTTSPLMLSLSNSHTGTTTVTAGTLLISADHTLGGTTNGTTVSTGGTLGLQGGFSYTTAEALSLSGTGASGRNGALDNVSGSNLYAGVITLNSASVQIGTAADSTLTLSGGIGETGGARALTYGGAGSTILSHTNSYTGGTTVSSGDVTVNSGASLAGSTGGLIVNGGSLTFNQTAQTVSKLSGTGGTLTLGSGHTLTVNQSTTSSFSGTVNGSGGLTKTGSGSLTLTAANYSGPTSLSTGTFNAIGSIGALSTSSGTTFSTGATPGLLTINGNLTLGGLTLMKLSGTGVRGTAYDALNVTGSLTFGGTLQLSLLSGFTPTAGNSFDLLNYSTATGTFSTLTLPTLTNGLAWNTSTLYSDGIISVVSAIPEPSTYAALAGLLALAAATLRRQRLSRTS